MGFMSGEELVVTLAPVAVYWAYACIYEALLQRTTVLDRYRLHSRRDEETKNIASRKDVVRGVLLQQAIQVAISVAVLKLEGHGAASDDGRTAPEPFLVLAARFGVAMLVLDAWQYFMHRLMHSVPYLYRRFHSWHHRVAAPYAYASQYGHPVDGVLTETLSGAAAYLISGMSPRVAAAFFAFATVKGVDDHCGVSAPWNPLQAVFRNNAAYHEVHHQRGGGRRNFSQPFFVVWDRLLGTHAPYALRRRDGGGLEVRAFKDPTR
ncbi:Sphinganine C4-monooxygenase 2 [Dichanthelium oligosanthes]|uniref:aldehyde oxygenase (deformylating) n=1 Tax=Dichanthelium oligosanthes TaxID=888268 RepID=A0A1E5W4F4_9POAL|nr:Sphinganine C4-monooxygenase 2 [Dichanthelium oligosanthes]